MPERSYRAPAIRLPADLLAVQRELTDQRLAFVLATVVSIDGSSVAKPGSKALFDATGTLRAGWVGGGCALNLIRDTALDCLASGQPRTLDIDLRDEVFGAGMPCGGAMSVFIEPVLPQPRLWLTGNGRIVETLCQLAALVGFAVTLIDEQSPADAHGASCTIGDDPRFERLQPEAGDYVIVASHHRGDYDALLQALRSEAVYIGLIASRHRGDLVRRRLAQTGIAATELTRIRYPAGLDLGAKTPEEIALSIAAELVQSRRSGAFASTTAETQKHLPNLRRETLAESDP